jgi:RNA polymerase sigma-70 factor (ECF subfamily)
MVFMFEGKRVVVGEAILSEIAATETDRVEPEHATLESLVRDYSRLVYRIAYAVLRSHHDAEEATQETFMRVVRYSSKLSGIENPKTWLARIAWRVAVDRAKRLPCKYEVPLEDSTGARTEIPSTAVGADEHAHTTQLSTVLEKLIATLPLKLREPLILSTLEEMSPKEVAATLGINEAAVRSRVFRARQILKEKLTQRAGR